MSLLTGFVVGRGIASRADGSSIAYRIVVPDKSPQNLELINSESRRWQGLLQRFQDMACQGKLGLDVPRRAKFGTEVFSVLRQNLELRICCQLIVQSYDGQILGIATYQFMNDTEGGLNLLVIDPEHVAGSPGGGQLRGIGSALLAAVARAFLITKHTTMYIHPLDEQAAIFWRNRGFGTCGARGLMCVRSQDAIMRLRNICETMRDGVDGQDLLLCGLPRETSSAGACLP